MFGCGEVVMCCVYSNYSDYGHPCIRNVLSIKKAKHEVLLLPEAATGIVSRLVCLFVCDI